MDIPKRKSRHKLTGLGDVVALVAKPFARAIDAAAHSDLENCSGCAKRQEMLNRAVPFKPQSPPAGAPPPRRKPEPPHPVFSSKAQAPRR